MTISAGATITAADIQAIKDDIDAVTGATTATVATAESVTSTSYGDPTTPGPAVTVTTGTAALVIVSAQLKNTTIGALSFMDHAVSGATTRAAADTSAFIAESSSVTGYYRGSAVHLHTGLTAGSNTFTAKYRVTSGDCAFKDRSIIVIPLGV